MSKACPYCHYPIGDDEIELHVCFNCDRTLTDEDVKKLSQNDECPRKEETDKFNDESVCASCLVNPCPFGHDPPDSDSREVNENGQT